jgi:hypothetical protein
MSLGDKLERRALERLVGRRVQLERLEAFALGDEPLVMHIQGIPGIGKTHLLHALAASIAAKDVSVVRLDAHWCEPSATAFSRAIAREIGASESEDFRAVANSLSGRGGRVLLVLDSYESFRLLDSWLRQFFLPSLGFLERCGCRDYTGGAGCLLGADLHRSADGGYVARDPGR